MLHLFGVQMAQVLAYEQGGKLVAGQLTPAPFGFDGIKPIKVLCLQLNL